MDKRHILACRANRSRYPSARVREEEFVCMHPFHFHGSFRTCAYVNVNHTGPTFCCHPFNSITNPQVRQPSSPMPYRGFSPYQTKEFVFPKASPYSRHHPLFSTSKAHLSSTRGQIYARKTAPLRLPLTVFSMLSYITQKQLRRRPGLPAWAGDTPPLPLTALHWCPSIMPISHSTLPPLYTNGTEDRQIPYYLQRPVVDFNRFPITRTRCELIRYRRRRRRSALFQRE